MDREWQLGKTLAECNWYMLDNQIDCDVTFRVGEAREMVMAHKYVLGSRSAVFYAMLYGPMAEKGGIFITDMEPHTFKSLLRYIYTEEAMLSGDNVLAVMHAANKYAMVGLEDKCVNFLMQNLTAENVCSVLESAHCFNKESVLSHCVEFIKDSPGAFETDNFLSLCSECLRKVLLLDDLVMDEEEIFHRVMEWASVQCQNLHLDNNGVNKRNVLENCLYCIRFPIMRMAFFNEIVCKTDILSEREIEDVTRQMAEVKICQTKFCVRKRRGTDLYSCKRFSYDRIDLKWGRKTGRIDFYVDVQIILTGLLLYGGHGTDSNRPYVYAALEDSDHDQVLTDVTKQVSVEPEKTIFKLKFPRSIRLEPDVRYSVFVQKEGWDSHWGDAGMASVVTQDVNFYFLTTYKSEQTNRARGLIPGLLFTKGYPTNTDHESLGVKRKHDESF
ncbi:BTB/POZ domain-containing protein 6-like isoform X3 [Ostrea edulis]|uniref:BTB/POZ domain-containing protein 6-like isoform X3 n=1 Tax=Ostrea edulis TaxID=37623 RepID=UPI0024AF3D99|nr:BTB/POZ domain-containing protein 6-like isoform X3 [Ostrea edulis]